MQKPADSRRTAMICLLLALVTVSIYFPIRNHEFIDFDDLQYIAENPIVQGGITRAGIIWAFTTDLTGNWHPLTWLSHMLDCQMFGLDAGAHHMVNVGIHVINAILLLLVLRQMTGALWQSAFVAAVFALHPLHVESVAWASERKDVLSALFWILTMWAYVHYSKRPGLKRYVPVVIFLALGLMAKPMLITIPFVLLLMDFWPLGRMGSAPMSTSVKQTDRRPPRSVTHPADFTRLIVEKIPLFILSAASALVTLTVQSKGGAVTSVQKLSLGLRIENSLVSYVEYIAKTFWPTNLAVFYPHPLDALQTLVVLGAGLLLIIISAAVLITKLRYPFLITGWVWYLVTLLPVIGIIQIGGQAMADRYMYLPMIGLLIMVAWLVPSLLSHWKEKRSFMAAAAILAISSCALATSNQLSYWENDLTLFKHANAVTTNNYIADAHLGAALGKAGDLNGAFNYLAESLRLKPEDAGTQNNMGICLAQQGRLSEAMRHFEEAVRIDSNHWNAHYNLGLILAGKGNFQEAIGHFRTVLRIKPDSREAGSELEKAEEHLARMKEPNMNHH